MEFVAHPIRESARAVSRNRDIAEDDTDALLAVGGIGLGFGRRGGGVVCGFGGNLHRARVALRRGLLRLAGQFRDACFALGLSLGQLPQEPHVSHGRSR